MFTPAFGARDGETCATPASARGAPAATLRHSSSFVFATPVTARHDAPALTPQPRAFRRDVPAATFPRPEMPRGEPMALDVGSLSEAFASAGARDDPHAQWHTPAPCVSARAGGADPAESEPRSAIVFGRIPRHDGRAPNPKRDASAKSGVSDVSDAYGDGDVLLDARALKASTCKASFNSSFNSSRRAGHPRVSELLLKPPRTIRVAAEPSLYTVPETTGAEAAETGGPITAQIVARQLFDEAETQRRGTRAGGRACPYGDLDGDLGQQNKAARSSLAMRSPRKPAETATRVAPGGDVQPRRTSSRGEPDASRNRLSASETQAARESIRESIDVDRFAEPASNMPPSHATEAPSAPGFGAAAFGDAEKRPSSRTASRVCRLLRERERLAECRARSHGHVVETDDTTFDDVDEPTRSIYASPFATARELLGYGASDDDASGDGGLDESFDRAFDRAFPGRDLGGVEGFVEAFESGNDAFARSEAACGSRGFAREFGENRGGLPASRLEDRFASLGLGLAAER